MKRDPASPAPSDNRRSTRPVRPLDWAQEAAAVDLVRREMDACVHRRRQRRWVSGGAVLAGLALATGSYWFLSDRPALSPGERGPQIVSATTAAREVLSDGSVVELKGDAEIAVDYEGTLRRVVLRRGEAHFDVRSDATRPFVVEALDVEVRAIGTAFLVELDAKGVEVVVTAGRVAVSKPTTMADPLAVLDAGKVVAVRNAAPIDFPLEVRELSEADLAERLAWRAPRLVFNRTPLSEVIPTFNHYNAVQLSLAEPELAKLELSGVLRANNVPVLLQILEGSYGLKVEYRTPTDAVLSR